MKQSLAETCNNAQQTKNDQHFDPHSCPTCLVSNVGKYNVSKS
jgi:hypothetical protein